MPNVLIVAGSSSILLLVWGAAEGSVQDPVNKIHTNKRDLVRLERPRGSSGHKLRNC